MQRAAFGAALLLAAGAGPAWAQSAEPDRGAIEQRIEQDFGLLGARTPLDPLAIPSGNTLLAPADSVAEDASLAQPAGSVRLPTPIDPSGIDQRIDKGLTAAGESSAFPPDLAFGAFQRGYFLTAFSLALTRAQAGDPIAQTLLGELLSRGLGVKQDLAAAFDWYTLAAGKEDAEALYALGRFYLEGAGVQQDFAKAADFLERAAKKGHAVAARELAYLLLQGKGREKNAMLAAAYLRRAAGLGDVEAEYSLAGLYAEGVGVVADDQQAARWYGAAARNGHVGAQIEYAILLFNGTGVPKDEGMAARWLGEAATADNPVAQIRLAKLLAEGRGVDADPSAAARWYLIAKARGLQDDFLDDWLARLDNLTRTAAAEAAEHWTAARPRQVQASAAAAQQSPAVDKQVE